VAVAEEAVDAVEVVPTVMSAALVVATRPAVLAALAAVLATGERPRVATVVDLAVLLLLVATAAVLTEVAAAMVVHMATRLALLATLGGKRHD